MKKDEQDAKDQAELQMGLIMDAVNRIDHLRECDVVDCDLTSEEIYNGLGYTYVDGLNPSAEEIEDYHDEDLAITSLLELALEVTVRSGWVPPLVHVDLEVAEYQILLCTGGPAVRVIGAVGSDGYPLTARLEYQDWFIAWTEYPADSAERDALLKFAGWFSYEL